MAAWEDKPLRRRQLLRLVDAEGFLTVASLCRLLDASEPTVRRDLAALAAEGQVRRVRGGAVTLGPGELPFVERMRLNAPEKQAIAVRAARLVRPGQRIALDIGTTMVYLAHNVARRGATSPETRFVTNGLQTARALSRSGLGVTVTGGVLRPGEDSLTGPAARRTIRDHRFDAFFLSASAVTPRGVVDVNMDEIEVKQEFALRSRAVYALVDASKVVARAPGLVALPLRVLTAVVTGPGASPLTLRALRRAGVALVEAPPVDVGV